MGEQQNGLTLEGLAQRLEALERENAELRNEVVALRGSDTRRNEPAERRGLVPHRDGKQTSAFEGPVSRRLLISKAGAAAVAAVAAGMLLSPREARAEVSTFDKLFANEITVAGTTSSTTFWGVANSASVAAVYGENRDSGPAVEGISNFTGAAIEGTANGTLGYGVRGTGYFGVWGESDRAGGYGLTGRNTNTDGTGVKGVTNNTDGRAGVRGEGRIGVWGSSPNVRQAGVKGDGVTGVWGVSSTTSYSGVYGEHTGTYGHGTVGIGKGEAAGVLGRNNTGEGVRGEGRIGVRGISAIAGQAGVYAERRGTDGPGVIGDGSGSDYAGVLGRNASGTGVWGQSGRSGYSGVHGEHTGTNGNGVVGDGKGGDNAGVLGRNPGGSGVRGESPFGYGGSFKGGQAQLMLVPGSSRGKPTAGTHTRGEIYMDSAGTLFVCTVGDGTTVGTWRKLTSTTA